MVQEEKKKQNNTKTKTIYPFESLLLTKTLLSLVYIPSHYFYIVVVVVTIPITTDGF